MFLSKVFSHFPIIRKSNSVIMRTLSAAPLNQKIDIRTRKHSDKKANSQTVLMYTTWCEFDTTFVGSIVHLARDILKVHRRLSRDTFFCTLLNEAFSVTKIIWQRITDDKWWVNWKGAWKEAVMTEFKVLSRHSPGGTEENHEKPQNNRTPVWDFNPIPPE
jgi:hypothetical protein